MTLQAIKVACSNCNLRELCMPMGLSDGDLGKLDSLVTTRRRLKRGTPLFSNGDPFNALYAIRTGFFKTSVATEDGCPSSGSADVPGVGAVAVEALTRTLTTEPGMRRAPAMT